MNSFPFFYPIRLINRQTVQPHPCSVARFGLVSNNVVGYIVIIEHSWFISHNLVPVPFPVPLTFFLQPRLRLEAVVLCRWTWGKERLGFVVFDNVGEENSELRLDQISHLGSREAMKNGCEDCFFFLVILTSMMTIKRDSFSSFSGWSKIRYVLLSIWMSGSRVGIFSFKWRERAWWRVPCVLSKSS